MKSTLALLAFLATSFATFAGDLSKQGLADPVVTPPAAAYGDWTGFYVGAEAYRETTTAEGQRCFKLGQPKACDDPIFDVFPEFKEIETFSLSETIENSGAFIGYRHDFGRIVGGIEANASGGQLQLGLDLNRVLPYGFAGTGGAYGVGLDVAVGKRLLLGVQRDLGDAQTTTVRIGYRL